MRLYSSGENEMLLVKGEFIFCLILCDFYFGKFLLNIRIRNILLIHINLTTYVFLDHTMLLFD